MANELRLKVQINDAEVIKSLGTIDDLATEISKTPYKLKVQVEGADAVSKEMVSLAKAQAQAKKAEADLQRQRNQTIAATAALTRAQNELAVSQEKTRQATEKTAQAEEKTRQAVQKTQQTWVSSAAKVAAAEEKTKQATEKTAQAQEKTRQEIEKTTRSTQNLNSAAQTFLGTLSAWAASRAISFVKQQFQEALNTMREVDQEMINIRKVSNYSDAELTAIQSGAYATANRYGVDVTSYLGSVAAWAKAGYDNADALAELSTKLELVGDVSSDVATKFLLSADAAWKYKGNIEDLNHVIDAANIIENNFATSIDKIAEGFPIVASTAGAFGMSVDETVAALGTLTAATQESGRKSATALRSLILNLSKEVGVVEDGVEVTEGSVSKLYEMLEKYEPAALKAAAATGTLVDPMTAVSALAQASADGLLSEAEMAMYLGEIGGKLRTNQLIALVNSQEMYNEMLGKTREAAGSADMEVSAMLDSWNAKTEILKNTWTEFVAEVVDTQVIKDSITGLTQFVDELTTIVRTLKALREGDTDLSTVNPDAQAFNTFFIEQYRNYAKRAKEHGAAIMEATEWGKLYEAELRRIFASLNETTSETENNTESLEENTEAQQKNTQSAQENAEAISGAAAAKNAYDEAMKAEEHDDAFKNYTAAFKTLKEEIDAGRVNSNAFWASAEFLMGPEALDEMGRSAEKVVEHAAEIAPMFNDADSAGRNLLSTMEEYANKNGDIVDSTGNLVAHVESLADGGWNWFIEDADALASILGVDVEAITAMQEAMRVFSAVTVTGHEEEQEAAEKAQTAIDNVAQTSMDPLVGQIDNVSAALDRATGKADNLRNSLRSGGSITPYATGTNSAPGGPALVNDGNGPELIADRGSAYIAGGGRPTIVNLSRGARVFTAEQTRSILGRARGGRIPAYARGRSNKDWTQDEDGNIVLFTGPTTNYTPGATEKKKEDNGGSGYTAAAAVTAPDMKEAQSLLDDLLKNLDQQAKLAKNEGRYEDMNALYKQAQDEIQKVIDQYLEAGYSETSTEVLTLKNKILDYAGKMEDLAAKAWKELESSLSDTLKNLDQQAKLLTNQGDLAGANSIYERAQDEIQSLIDKYLAAGYSETSDEVLALKNKIFDYAGKMEDLAAKAWEDLENALSDSLKSLDQQAKLLTNQGDLAGANSVYQQAQKEIQSLIDRYLEAGYSETSDEVVSLTNRLYDYADKVVDLEKAAWEELEDALDAALDQIDKQITLAKHQGDTAKILELYGQAQSLIEKQINDYLAAGYAADSPEVLALANRGYGYAESQKGEVDSLWNNLLQAIEGLKDATEDANDLAEKQLAVEEAAKAYENAKSQRTVRVFNPKTGQWEWIADDAALQNARKNLESAQNDLRDREMSQALESIKAGGGSVGSILASPYLAANYGSAGQEAQMAFLAALGAWSGSVDRTGSAARSSMFQSTSSDSHDQNYTIGGVTLTREQAEGMTLADLARYLGYADLAG